MVRATLIRLGLTPSIWLMVASTMWKNSATTTMKIAGALPMPNMKIATGSQAMGDTGESSVTVGNTSRSKRCQYRGDHQAREHARRRGTHRDHHRFERRRAGVHRRADGPPRRRVEELALVGDAAQEDVRRRQQLGIRPADRPAQFPDAGKQRDREARPPDLGQRIEAAHRG